MTWAESVDELKIIEKDGQKFKQIIKDVGPIWGQHEAEEKVNAFLSNNGMSDWTWTGAWNSEGGTSYSQFEKTLTWAESVDEIQTILKDGRKFDLVVKHVGPIWGQYEAEKKVNAFMAKNEMTDWKWTGAWNSEGGTSYAQFEKETSPLKPNDFYDTILANTQSDPKDELTDPVRRDVIAEHMVAQNITNIHHAISNQSNPGGPPNVAPVVKNLSYDRGELTEPVRRDEISRDIEEREKPVSI